MTLFIIVGFLGAIVVIAAFGKVVSKRVSPKLGLSYICFTVLAACAAAYTSFQYIYFTNPNTKFHGWPIPTVVFQRDDADSPWLDFICPMPYLSYPMNLILFLVIPSILLLVWSRCRLYNEQS